MSESEIPQPNFEILLQDQILRVGPNVQRYIQTPIYAEVPEEQFRYKYGLDYNPHANAFIQEVISELKTERYKTDFLARVKFIEGIMDQIQALPGKERQAARRVLLFNRSLALEQHATFALQSSPLSDPERRFYFLNAAEGYIDADLQTCGFVTDYGLRAVESFAGAGLNELFVDIVHKVFGPRLEVVNKKKDRAKMAIVIDLMKRSKRRIQGVVNGFLLNQEDSPDASMN